MAEFVVLRLDKTRFALQASAVERIVPAVEITPLPQAPAIVLGVVNVHGSLVAVIDFRHRFGLPHQEIALSNRLVIAHTATRTLALIADAVDDVVDYSTADITVPSTLVTGIEQISGIAKHDGDITFIHDLECFLAAGEAASLDLALASAEQGSDGH